MSRLWQLWLWTVAVTLCWPTVARSFELSGQRLKVSGQWDGARLVASRVQVRDASRDVEIGRVKGRITAIDASRRSLQVGPITVMWNDKTSFRGMERAAIATDLGIEAVGRLLSPRRVMATVIRPKEAGVGSLQLLGAVEDGVVSSDGNITMTLLGVPVAISPGTYASGAALVQRVDDRRPAEQLTVQVFDRPLTLGGEYEIVSRYRRDFSLGEDEDDLLRLDQGFQLELFYALSDRASLFLEGKGFAEGQLYDEDGERSWDSGVERGEMWLYVGSLGGSPVSLQVGRQNFVDGREWWWDEDLDALRLHYDRWPLHMEAAIAQELAVVASDQDEIDPEEDGILRVLGRAAWEWAPRQRLEWFFLHHHDRSSRPDLGERVAAKREDDADAKLTWIGARLVGRSRLVTAGEVRYWLDGGGVWGDERRLELTEQDDGTSVVDATDKVDVRGWGVDGGMSWVTDLPGRPTLTLGYAWGSGDRRSDDGVDRNFRQTGLQDNNGRFHGVDRFRYYGELLRPELSNLSIQTAAVGLRPSGDTSIELLYHRYRQVQFDDALHGRIDADPTGEHRSIGSEWDLIVGLEEWEHLEIELIGAMFEAGAAFGDLEGERAYNAVVKVNYNF